MRRILIAFAALAALPAAVRAQSTRDGISQLLTQAVDGQRVLGEDVSTGDVPLLTFTAAGTGPRPLAVIVTECRTALCCFGMEALAR
ncbi:hypothetical protein [Longimicrobium sp.]|jgi:hypothetical protein|uniref:hypothetical protein n=1 Tax=Longimicrobium sp. TaxID=2029185 RepID=UPI002F945A18